MSLRKHEDIEYDAFISYFESNATEFADRVYKTLLEEYNIHSFVAHRKRNYYSSDFDKKRIDIIKKSKFFIFINTLNAFTRNEIIKEFYMAYPKGLSDSPKLIIFRHKDGNPARTSLDFEEKTGIKGIDKQNQHDFTNIYDLYNRVIEAFKEEPFYKEKIEQEDNLNLEPFKGEKSIFVGRQEEIIEISKLLKEKSIISVVGEGGIGKSSLVFRVLRIDSNVFNKIIMIYVDSKFTYLIFLQKVADSLSITLGKEYNEELLRKSIYNKLFNIEKTLLFLDNYDNISTIYTKSHIPEDIKKINNFLEELPNNVTLLLTSRNKDNIKGEHPVPISGLGQSESRDLFFILTQKHFRESPDDNFVVELDQILSKINYHPLGIKLLAGAYKGKGISELKNISNELIYIHNKLEIEKRFISLKSCFDYSFKKLSKNQKKFLILLSVFDSPFLDVIAIKVTKISEDILDQLNNLSFINQYSTNMYINGKKLWIYDFHPLIKLYLSEKASKQEMKRLSKHLANIYFKFIQSTLKEIGGKNHIFYSKIIEIIIKNPINDFEKTINYTHDLGNKSLISNNIGIILNKLRYWNQGLEYHKKCLEYDKDNPSRLANDYVHIGNYFSHLGDTEPKFLYIALEYYNFAKKLHNENKEKSKYDDCMDFFHLGSTYLKLDNLPLAFTNLKEANEINQELKDLKCTLLIKNVMGEYFRKTNNLYKSLGCLQEVLKIEERSQPQYKIGIAADYKNLGLIYKILEYYDIALEHYKKSLSIYQELDDVIGQKEVCKNLIELLNDTNKTELQDYIKLYMKLDIEVKNRKLTEGIFDIY